MPDVRILEKVVLCSTTRVDCVWGLFLLLILNNSTFLKVFPPISYSGLHYNVLPIGVLLLLITCLFKQVVKLDRHMLLVLNKMFFSL